MANNRMYVVCSVCGDKFYLGKRMASGYYLNEGPHKDELGVRLVEFYDRHEESCLYQSGFGADHYTLDFAVGRELAEVKFEKVKQ